MNSSKFLVTFFNTYTFRNSCFICVIDEMRMLSLVGAVVLLLLRGSITLATAASSVNIALPGCKSKCGDVDIPYPFGTTPGCYQPGFMVTCNETHRPPKLFLDNGAIPGPGPEVVEVSLANSTVRVGSWVSHFVVGNTSHVQLAFSRGSPFVLSAKANSLVIVGCGFRVLLHIVDGWTYGSCASFCPINNSTGEPFLPDVVCNGIGCCQPSIPIGLRSCRIELSSLDGAGGCPIAPSPSPAPAFNVSVHMVEQEWWSDGSHVYGLQQYFMDLLSYPDMSPFFVPAIAAWGLGELSCEEAAQRPDFGCHSKNSMCLNSTNGAEGYVCRCSDGYQGNPYMTNGCQGGRGRLAAGIIFSIGVGSGIIILLLVLAVVFAIKKVKDQKAKMMKEYFFKQNRGLLLQQLVDTDIAERMIFSLEELETATNKFDEARILGGGGHGTVYKGILSDQHVVAIKKSKTVIKREIDEFINEVAILSQINHRNVVKLFGCCLETEVPLLIYEFISNGTLYAHLHTDGPQSLSWKDRLRIAYEVASSLAYLHSAALISTIHRDIKTSNILLDDRLTAKVSDFGASRGIAIDQSGVTTAIQGTYGYLDPEYYYTGRLTEKSDVYSFGVMLVELLTRKKPTSYVPSEGVSLVAHFMLLLNQDRLSEILDSQVSQEAGDEAKEVAAIAAMCLGMKGEDRPTMRYVETKLQGLQSLENTVKGDPEMEEVPVKLRHRTFERSRDNADKEGHSNSRRYSMEEAMLFSASLQR
ncbi:wall-associated receptor kinase 3-like [Aegilops tauschii subsp. strangulata]|uniref:Protein kinase domain-containing protein n=3 Tax=Aegilops tauschii subsp. strangulata TaxID=200361 RepID=A0A453RIY5_AEGTS|nr:wall-associated receptor kinase 3 [Aegilops tauschii subsp. strangulata]